ncbi:MAG: GTPase, partial [Candidatus Altiarchaeota archaeon]
IASYPFTTQGILMGYVKVGHMSVQVIDSPGLLDRPMEDRNKIELQAALALSELADCILFVVDPTVDVEPQFKLYEEVSQNFDVRIVVAINKVDVASKEEVCLVSDLFEGACVVCFSAIDAGDCRRVFDFCWGDSGF